MLAGPCLPLPHGIVAEQGVNAARLLQVEEEANGHGSLSGSSGSSFMHRQLGSKQSLKEPHHTTLTHLCISFDQVSPQAPWAQRLQQQHIAHTCRVALQHRVQLLCRAHVSGRGEIFNLGWLGYGVGA